MPFQELRRTLAEAGALIATTRAPGTRGRFESSETRPATLLEDSIVIARPVGAPETCPEPLAFLDGIQRHQVVAYVGAAPILGATVAAGVREREGRRLRTVVELRERLIVGRSSALEGLTRIPDGHRVLELPDEGPSHPIRDQDAAVAAIDDARSALEVRAGERFRRRSEGWLIVDGSLAESTAWAADPRMLAVATSHATLPFEGTDLVTYLHLPEGYRSSVFQPASRRFAPVYAWGLRLRAWMGRDLFFGHVRVEAAPGETTLARADELSRWVLAERAPVCSGDSGWDRLLYGIHSVGEYLRAVIAEP